MTSCLVGLGRRGPADVLWGSESPHPWHNPCCPLLSSAKATYQIAARCSSSASDAGLATLRVINSALAPLGLRVRMFYQPTDRSGGVRLEADVVAAEP